LKDKKIADEEKTRQAELNKDGIFLGHYVNKPVLKSILKKEQLHDRVGNKFMSLGTLREGTL